jgi:aspartate oxidase
MAELAGGNGLAGLAGLKAVGGFASGVTSATIQGRSVGATLAQGGINAAVSWANPAGAFVSNSIGSGAVNSFAANLISQAAINGSVNWLSALGAGVARGAFGYMSMGFVMSASCGDYAAQGMISGTFSAGAGILFNAASGM